MHAIIKRINMGSINDITGIQKEVDIKDIFENPYQYRKYDYTAIVNEQEKFIDCKAIDPKYVLDEVRRSLIYHGLGKTGNPEHGQLFRDLIKMGPTGPFNTHIMELDGRSLNEGFETLIPEKIISMLRGGPKEASDVGDRLRKSLGLNRDEWKDYLIDLKDGLMDGFVVVTP